MNKFKENQGFSLVELIIVIAIMAVLVGILVPTYLKYVEKSRISSDSELADSICKAITFAASDPKILEDSASATLVDNMASATQGTALEDLENTSNSLADEVKDTLGWDDLTKSTYQSLLKSRHNTSSTIYIQNQGTVNTPYIVWISYTDRTGAGNLRDASDKDDIGDCIVVR